MSMSPATRAKYFSQYWPAACAAKGWRAGDQEKRRQVALEGMRLVRGPAVTTSDARFGADEITALFCYLDHLAHPADLDRAARWVDCQTDYRAFNRARQADYHEAATYGASGSKRLRRQRFGGAASAAGEPLERFDPAAIKKRHLTMATRHQAKQRGARAAAAGQDLASHAPHQETEIAPGVRAMVSPDAAPETLDALREMARLARQQKRAAPPGENPF